LFNSIEFVGFFVVVAALSACLPGRGRWVLLLAASYVFYACFTPWHLALLVGESAATYLAALGLARARRRGARTALLVAAVAADLGALAAFKYLGFLDASTRPLLEWAGLGRALPALELALPVGISFYTFLAVSYVVDVYRGALPAERHPGRLALYVAFFPQLVAGPITRSTRLIPQLAETARFDHDRIAGGLALMLLGFFEKLVVADRLAVYVDAVYGAPADHQGLTVLLATYCFAVQIYCDFSGYSNIAIGAARVLGYDLTGNFDRPYAARSVAEFWRRWHITLSTWFRDYLYIPLGGNRCARPRWALNVMAVFVLSGLWHGAAWTFVAWGALHGLYLVVGVLSAGPRERLARRLRLDRLGPVRAMAQVAVVFNLVSFAWIFFRARSLGDAFVVIGRLASIFREIPRLGGLLVPGFDAYELGVAAAAIALLGLLRHVERRVEPGGFLATRPIAVRWPVYLVTLAAILVFGHFEVVEFVYSQF
jgi:D-alanyl-lipoteichoic acid acyltransferase DltB (MBOAT superfamily)